MKSYVVGVREKHLGEVLLMSTNNICFCGEIRKNIHLNTLLSRAMFLYMLTSADSNILEKQLGGRVVSTYRCGSGGSKKG